jgi:hypothetical protein
MTRVNVNNLNSSVINKKLRAVIDNDVDVTPPYTEIQNNEFTIANFEYRTSELRDLQDNIVGQKEFVVLFNQAGISLFVEKNIDAFIDVE